MNPTDPRHPRCFTNKVLKAVEDGLLSYETLVRACLDYMSDAEVADMVEDNDLLYDEYAEWDDDDDDEPTELTDEGEEEWDCSPSPASMGLSRDWKK